MCSGARLFRIRGNDVGSTLKCFDVGAPKYRKDSQLSALNQSTLTSEPWEAEGPD